MNRFSALADSDDDCAPVVAPAPVKVTPKPCEPVSFFLAPSSLCVTDEMFAGAMTKPASTGLGAAVVAAQATLMRSGDASSLSTAAVDDIIAALMKPQGVPEPTPVAIPTPSVVPSASPSGGSQAQSQPWNFEALGHSTHGAKLTIEQSDAVKVRRLCETCGVCVDRR